jgi:DNA-binding MarR family transcriptional regulator
VSETDQIISTTPDQTLASVEAILNEATKIHHRLSALLATLHRQGEFSAGKRAILRDLAQLGPQTVPQLARARPVSRQFIQKLVNELAAEGYVEFSDNLAHRRSHLVRITSDGQAHLTAMQALEAKVLSATVIALTPQQLNTTLATLSQLHTLLVTKHFELSTRPGNATSQANQENGQHE